MNYESALLLKYLAPNPNRSRALPPILNPPKKIGSQINRIIGQKAEIGIIFSGGNVLISTINLAIGNELSGK